MIDEAEFTVWFDNTKYYNDFQSAKVSYESLINVYLSLEQHQAVAFLSLTFLFGCLVLQGISPASTLQQ